MKDGLVYLASPYSDPDPVIKEMRFVWVAEAAAYLFARGIIVFSPIIQGHVIAQYGNLRTGWDVWETFDRLYMKLSYKMIVFCLPGWTTSVGVRAEIAIMRNLGKEIEYLDPQVIKKGENDG